MQVIKKVFIFVCISAFNISLSAQVTEYPTFDEFENKVLNGLDENKSYIINFWATWCKPCVKELPYFENITAQNIEDIEVILVSLDFKKQIERKLLPFLKKNQLKSKVVVLSDGKYNNWIDRIDDKWSGSIPATLFISKGEKLFKEQEYHSAEEILADLSRLN
jgi:thiol-disulfide isomerase/thioredoxin